MANILVSVTEANVNVTTTSSNITITDYESNSIIGNVITTSSNVNVTTPVTNVIVTGGVEVSNIDVRAALSNVSPILYDQANGIFSFDSNASFSSKTTDDLAEGNVNLYFTNARVDARVPTSIVNGNIALKQYNETIFNAGNIQGNATFNIANGTIQTATLIGNVTNITFTNAAPGTTVTLILTQDAIGNWTTPTTSVLTNWQFAGNIQTINNAPLSTTYLTAVVETSGVKASIVKFTNADLEVDLSNNTTDDLAEGNVNLYFTTARARQSISATGDISYNANTGVISYTGTPGDINSVTAGAGLTGGGTSGDVTLNVGAGTGITVNADNVAVNMGAFTTTDLAEGTNLYYTTARANTAIDNRLVGGTGVSYNAGTIALDFTEFSTSNISEGTNLYYSNARVNAFIQNNITTSDIDEGTNLYFTTARARQSISGTGDISYDANTGVISYIGTPGDISDVVAGAGLTGGGSSGNVTLNVGAGTGITVNADNVAVNMAAFTTTDLAEGTNLYYTDIRANSAIDARVNKAFVEGLGVSYTSLSDKPTIPTHTSNLTNDSGFITASTANVVSVNGETGVVVLDTGDIAENGNLYFTSARANTAIANKLLDSTKKQIFNVDIKDLYLTSNASQPFSSGYYMPNIPGNVGDTLQLTGSDQANWQRLTTANVDESGGNVYFTTARANTAIGAYQGAISTAGNITTTANVQGNYILGNGFFLTGITGGGGGGNVSLINTGENLTGGPITTTGTIGMANALANVSTITAEASKNIVLNTGNALVTQQKYSNVDVFSGNISSDGYAYFGANQYTGNAVISYTGSGNIVNFVFLTGNTTAGSNAITNVTGVKGDETTPLSLSDIVVNSLFDLNGLSPYPFPQNTLVTSVDVANSTVYMSANATASVNLALGVNGWSLNPVLLDTSTGMAISVASQFDAGTSSSKTTLAGSSPLYPGKYGYPKNGWTVNDFDVITAGTANDYTLGNLSKHFIARNKIEAPSTFLQLPRGLVVGNGDLTARAENDGLPSFGVNVLWDGLANVTAEYAGNTPQTQLLIKQYSNNSGAASAGSEVNSGPRLFFTALRGNKNQSYTETYPRINNELGRITWWGPTDLNPSPGTLAAPAFINAVTNRDFTTHNGGVGLYLVASPHTNIASRGLFLAHHLGNTVITSSGNTSTGATQPITFAPMTTATSVGTGSNTIQMFNNIMAATNYQWANINYDNATSRTGSRLSITNGASTVGARNGNISLVLDRNDNSVGFGNKEWALKLQPSSNDLVLTEDDVIRTTFTGANITTAGNITAGNTIVTGVAFNTTNNVAPTSGQIVYNADYGTHQMGLGGSNVILAGQDLVVYARNDEANTLLKGEVVYLFGATGDKASVKRAVNTSDATSAKTIGIVKQDITAGSLGYIVTQGVVDGINTSAYTAGDSLYLANVAGTFTNVKPSAPEHIVFIGVVERANAGNGQVLVRVQNGFELDEIHDVQLTSVAANDMLIRNSGNTLWVNQNFGTTVTNSNIKLKQFAETVVSLGNVSGDISSNINVANGTIYQMTTTGNITINSLANAVAGTSATLIITNGGSHTLTSTMKFAGGSKTLSTAANAIDIISVFYDGSTYYATLSKGYA